jgi:hypothetical protein
VSEGRRYKAEGGKKETPINFAPQLWREPEFKILKLEASEFTVPQNWGI